MSQSCLFLGVSKAGIVENILWWHCCFFSHIEIYGAIGVSEFSSSSSLFLPLILLLCLFNSVKIFLLLIWL